jgi:hypothetical protein
MQHSMHLFGGVDGGPEVSHRRLPCTSEQEQPKGMMRALSSALRGQVRNAAAPRATNPGSLLCGYVHHTMLC